MSRSLARLRRPIPARRFRTWSVLGLGAALACSSGGPSASEQVEKLQLRAQNALDQGRADFARLYYREAFELSADPQLRRAEGLAWLTGYQQSLSEGSDVLREVLEQTPDDREVRLRLAQTEELLGRFDEAQALYEDPLCDCPRELAALLTQRQPQRAISLLDALGPTNWQGRDSWNRARAAEAVGAEDALERSRSAAAVEPLDIEGLYLLARLEREAGNFAAAQEALELQRALRVLFADGTLGEAAPQAVLEQAEKVGRIVTPLPWRVERQRLEATARVGDSVSLRSGIRSAWQRDLSAAQQAELATLAGEHGLRSLAAELFTELVQRAPDQLGARASLALLAIEEGRFEDALRRLDEDLATAPHFARFHALRSRALKASSLLQEAEASLAQAVDLAPWEAAWRIDLAELRRLRGDATWSETLEEAPEQNPLLDQFRADHGLAPAQPKPTVN